VECSPPSVEATNGPEEDFPPRKKRQKKKPRSHVVAETESAAVQAGNGAEAAINGAAEESVEPFPLEVPWKRRHQKQGALSAEELAPCVMAATHDNVPLA